MNLRMFAVAAAAIAAACAHGEAEVAAGSAPDPQDLIGVWRVDLRPTPDAEPYVQPMTISAAGPGGLDGVFYGTPVAEGRVNTDWGAVRFAFTTADGSGGYNTSGVLRADGTIEGVTHSEGRDFLSYWTAVRAEE